MDIEATNLTKRYGRTTVVDNISLSVREGTVTGLLGPNGAGKSTTMRMLLGLNRPDSGRVLYGGKPLVSYRDPLAVVGNLLDARGVDPHSTPHRLLTAQAATHRISASRVDRVLGQAGLSAVAGKRVGGFSLGMSQRLGMALALLGDPRVLILDEPINGLDPDGVRWLRETLRSLAADGRTILVSSHLMAEMAQTADHVIVFGRGRILADAPIGEVMADAAGAATRVRSPRFTDLAAAFDSSVRVEQVAPGTGLVRGMDSEQIGLLAARHNIPLFELTPVQSSLEDAYLDLTAGAVDYTSERVA